MRLSNRIRVLVRQPSRLKSAYEVTRRLYKLGRRSSLAGACVYRWMRDARTSADAWARHFTVPLQVIRCANWCGKQLIWAYLFSLSLLGIVLDTCLLSIFISHIQRTLASRVISLKRMTSKSEVVLNTNVSVIECNGQWRGQCNCSPATRQRRAGPTSRQILFKC